MIILWSLPVHITGIMHWNPYWENSRDCQEQWHKLVLRLQPFAPSLFLHCRCSQRTSCVSSRTETRIHNVSQKSLPALKIDEDDPYFLLNQSDPQKKPNSVSSSTMFALFHVQRGYFAIRKPITNHSYIIASRSS